MARTTKKDGKPVGLEEGRQLADRIRQQLLSMQICTDVFIAGSLRRGKLVANDIDLLAIVPPEMPSAFACPEGVKKKDWEAIRPRAYWERAMTTFDLPGGGPSKIWGLYEGVFVDVMFVRFESLGTALMHCTGPMELNIVQRRRALSLGMTLNEHGLWRGNDRVAGDTEQDVYAALKLPFLQPSERIA